MAFLDAVTLTGSLVQLEPLDPSHADALRAATLDGRVWELWYASAPAPDEMASDIAARLGSAASGQGLPFALRRLADDTLVGVTTFLHPLPAVPAIEIGATWFNQPSRAIKRLGAIFEGRIRNDRVLRDGTVTDTAQYSLTNEQWPAVRGHLAHLLGQH